MAQETLKSLIAVMMTLSISEQEQVITEMQNNLRQLRKPDEATQKRLIARAEKGVEQIQRGEYYSNDEVLARAQQRLEQKCAVAV